MKYHWKDDCPAVAGPEVSSPPDLREKSPITITTPVVDRVARIPRHADLETVMMQADTAALRAIEDPKIALAMKWPPHSDTPFFNETHQFPRKSRRRPNPLPRPIQSTPSLNQVHYLDPNEGGQYKERRSSPHTDPGLQESLKTNDHPLSLIHI